MFKLAETEIRKRLQKLHNYEKILYPRLKERSVSIREENKDLKAENERLKEENQKHLEKILLQLEEIKILKFGKKRMKKTKISSVPKTEGRELEEAGKRELEKKAKKKLKKRPASSYRRAIPDLSKVTDHLKLEIEVCSKCGGKLVDKKEHVHYREDIKNVEKLIQAAKKIVETRIESGKCKKCNQCQFAMEVPKQKVIIGENIRRMVVFQTIIQGLSYAEVQKSMEDLYAIKISSGEIANILEGESRLMTPYYNNLVAELEKESQEYGAHYDETSWKTKDQGEEVSEGNYCWVKIGVKSQLRLIWFGRSRGLHVAEQLRGGKKKGSKGVSDDYGAYKNCFDIHSLCWSHPHRKLRDLAESNNISGKTKQVCIRAHRNFAKTYKKADKIRKKLLKGAWTELEKQKAKEKLEELFNAVLPETKHDPDKLRTLKKTLKKRKERYFTFLNFPWLPLDNNKAERAIKRVVLKRKKSFGCRSQKGADVLSVLYSSIFSVVETFPNENFFTLYEKILLFDEKGEI
ncbi:MAG: IS66 family transposase [Candidatus Pacebacteria bacterium]|jgi:transposase|nr:IS66 family transposase [Candidatus Paceibacterota bacterium]